MWVLGTEPQLESQALNNWAIPLVTLPSCPATSLKIFLMYIFFNKMFGHISSECPISNNIQINKTNFFYKNIIFLHAERISEK